MTEPSLGEVMRRIEDVTNVLSRMTSDMQNDRRDAASTYVRKDVQDGVNVALKERVSSLEGESDEREKRAADGRRQILLLVLGVSLPAIGALLLAVNNFLTAATAGASGP